MADMDLAKALNDARTILIDCDGVLTDGKLYIDHTGEKPFKAFHSRDVRAIRQLVSMGFEVVIVTADDWAGSKCFAEKVGAILIVSRDKGSVIDQYPGALAIGDDAWDAEMLKKAAFGFIPANADESLTYYRHVHRLKTCGGEGVIAEVVRFIVRHVCLQS